MNQYTGYEKILLKQLLELKETTKPVVLFGVKVTGLMCKRALDFLNIKAECFCDNDKTKQNTIIANIPVLSPEQVKERYPDAIIYLCLLSNENMRQVKAQFSNLGFADIYNKDVLMYVFQTEVLRRPINSTQLADTMYYLNNEEDRVTFKGIGAFITEKCNMRCKNCGYFIPYYKNPKHLDKNTIIKSIERLSKAVDAIAMLTILGGETLLYPQNDLIEICEYAYKLPNILLVRIVTNARIVPNDEMLTMLKNSLTHINFSDYEELSTKKEELKQKLDQHNIMYDISEQGTVWYPLEPPKKKNRTNEENLKLFQACCIEKDILHNGGLHLCEYSVVTLAQGKIDVNDNGYVNLIDNTITIDDLRNKIRRYIKNEKSISACDYCGYRFDQRVPRAEQTKQTLEWS
ncbi:MAG: radical SAM protein [Bacillota bacterium]